MKTHQEIENYVLANWRDKRSEKMARELRVGDKRVRAAYKSLHEKGLMPSGKEVMAYKSRHQHTSRTKRSFHLEYIVNNWMTQNNAQLARNMGIGRDTVSRMFKELADAGLMPTGKEIQSIKATAKYKEEQKQRMAAAKPIICAAWVPTKYVNKSAKWLGA